MCAHLEVLAAVLVLVRRSDHTDHVLLGRQWHWANYSRACTCNGVDDLACRSVNNLVVISLKSNADFLSGHLDSLSYIFVKAPTHAVGRVVSLREMKP